MNGLPGLRPRQRCTGPVVIVAALALAALGTAAWLLLSLRSREVDRTWLLIQETKVLRVCTDPSWLPFEFFAGATGQVDGFDIELANLVASRLVPGGRASIVTVGFDSLYDALLAGRCDAIVSALPYDPALTEDVSYSVAYFNSGPVLVVSERSPEIAGVEDLPGRVVGAEWGFVPEGPTRQRLLLRELPLRRYDTAWEVLSAAQSGEVEAALVDRISALGYLRQCQGLRIVGEPISEVNYVIPVRPDSPRLLEEIDRILLEMRRDGTLEALVRKWL